MATYATKENIDDLYGSDLLVKIADENRDGVPDTDVVERGLVSADGVIDGYLQGKYSLPLKGSSNFLTEIAVDIAVYKIALKRAVRTNEMRVRYEDALAMLDKVAAGKIGVGVVTDTDGTVDPGSTSGTQTGRSINTYLR